MTHVRPNLRLYLANRTGVLFTPVVILTIMLGLSLIVAGFIGIATGFPLPEGTVVRMRYNGGALYCVPGFLLSVGVLAMNRNFSMALAFGSTRRNFWLGTSIGFILTSLAVGVGTVLLLGLEILTDHWFINARAFDVVALGSGDPVQAFATMFVLSMLSLYTGAFFGTIYRALGTVWTSVAAVGLGVLALSAGAAFLWKWDVIAPQVVGWEAWFFVALGLVTAALMAAASYGANRTATV